MSERANRLHSSLHVPDSLLWHSYDNYVPGLAVALRTAYALLSTASERKDNYFDAFAVLIPYRSLNVCLEQRLVLEYASALAYAGDDAVPQALERVAHALDVADRLGDLAAIVELKYFAAALFHLANQHIASYNMYADALTILRQLEWNGISADSVLELDIVLRKGWRAWDLGRFPQSLRDVDDAYAIRAQLPDTAPSQAASLAWLEAQLARVRGQPQRAVAVAKPAAELLLASGRTVNTGRAHTVLAECALDLAQAPGDSDVKAHLRLARASTTQALAIARETNDVIGREMARLAQLKARRIASDAHANQDGIAAVERLLRTAKKLDDVALIGRAETALAEELAARGQWEAARTMNVRARAHLEEYDLGGLALWPRRALQFIDDIQRK